MAQNKVGGGKRIKKIREKVEHRKAYPVEQGCQLVAETASTKFDETVDVAFRLGIDAKKAEQSIRGSASLPHGLGKSIRVIVFAKGEKANDAQAAGADIVGAEDLVEKIKGGFTDFDSVVATPDMMVQVGKIGKILGPRGLMPSPKVGTVTFEVGDVVRSLKAGRAEFRADKAGIVHAPVGKASFGGKKLYENLVALVTALNKTKPANAKGVFLKSAALSCTMGPGVHIDVAPFRNA